MKANDFILYQEKEFSFSIYLTDSEIEDTNSIISNLETLEAFGVNYMSMFRIKSYYNTYTDAHFEEYELDPFFPRYNKPGNTILQEREIQNPINSEEVEIGNISHYVESIKDIRERFQSKQIFLDTRLSGLPQVKSDELQHIKKLLDRIIQLTKNEKELEKKIDEEKRLLWEAICNQK